MPLQISQVHIAVGGTPLVNGVSLSIERGTVHILMGPNGSGKSSFAQALAGHPTYAIPQGSVVLDGTDVTSLPADERARKGLFLSFQYPVAIAGVTVQNFLRTAYHALHTKTVDLIEFHKKFEERMNALGIPTSFLKRSINEDFSGGEKKRLEMLQLDLFKPAYAILDETDSGLDVDALKIVAQTINAAKKNNTGLLVITHYARIPNLLDVDEVHIMSQGRIVKSGSAELVQEVEHDGYAKYVTAPKV